MTSRLTEITTATLHSLHHTKIHLEQHFVLLSMWFQLLYTWACKAMSLCAVIVSAAAEVRILKWGTERTPDNISVLHHASTDNCIYLVQDGEHG